MEPFHIQIELSMSLRLIKNKLLLMISTVMIMLFRWLTVKSFYAHLDVRIANVLTVSLDLSMIQIHKLVSHALLDVLSVILMIHPSARLVSLEHISIFRLQHVKDVIVVASHVQEHLIIALNVYQVNFLMELPVICVQATVKDVTIRTLAKNVEKDLH